MRSSASTRAPWIGRTLLTAAMLAVLIGPFILFEAEVTAAAAWLLDHEGMRALVAAALIGLLVVDILAPVPSSLVCVGLGSLFGGPVGTLIAWLGLSLGAAAGYGLGRWLGPGIVACATGPDDAAFLEHAMARHGGWTIAVFRAVPVLAEASVLLAGCGRLPLGVFALAAALANLGIAAVYAHVGTFGLESGAMWLALAAGIALPALAWLAARLLRRHLAPRRARADGNAAVRPRS